MVWVNGEHNPVRTNGRFRSVDLRDGRKIYSSPDGPYIRFNNMTWYVVPWPEGGEGAYETVGYRAHMNDKGVYRWPGKVFDIDRSKAYQCTARAY